MGMLSTKRGYIRLSVGLIFICALTILTGQVLSQGAPTASQLEQEKFEFEKVKFDLEQRKANWNYWLEIYRMLLTAAAIAGPLLYGLYTLRKQAKYSFELKTAEILLNSKTPGQLQAKAEVLKELFPKAPLPTDFEKLIEKFNPEKYSGPSSEWKMELFKQLVANPERTKEAIGVWKRIFPNDEWIKRLESAMEPVTKNPNPKEAIGIMPDDLPISPS